jgi:hypothetical protein
MKLADLRDLGSQPFLDSSCPLPLDRPFTASQARDVGVGPPVLVGLVKAGFVRQPIKGVYVVAQVVDDTALRCVMLRMVMPPDCVVVDRHAGWLLGAPMALAPNEHVEARPISVFRPAGLGRLRNSLADSGERNLRPDDVMEIGGVRVTTPLRTAWDLGRTRYPEPAIAGIDAMLALGVDHDELLAGVERFKGMRWVTTLRAVAPLGDRRSQSPGESVLRLRWIQAGLPTPTPQVEVWRDGVLLGVLDLANEDLRYAAEYDGREWHSSPEQKDHDAGRRGEIEFTGWVIDPFVAENVFGMKQDAERMLRDGAARARRELGCRVGAK